MKTQAFFLIENTGSIIICSTMRATVSMFLWESMCQPQFSALAISAPRG